MKMNRAGIRKLVAVLAILVASYLGIKPDTLNSLISTLVPPKAGQAQVLEVIDGDTISVQFGDSIEKVRFIGLDTPETHHPSKAVQCFGEAAHQHLTQLIGGNDVILKADPQNTNRDRYDRLLRYVYLPDGTLLNLAMIEDGYGFAYVSFPFSKSIQFSEAQDIARDNERGLWGACEIEQDGTYINTAPAAADE
jgi:micrococcal nuclease